MQVFHIFLFQLCITLFFVTSSSAQNKTQLELIDSIKNVAWQMRYDDNKQALAISSKVIDAFQNFENDSMLAVAYNTRGAIFRAISNFDSAFYYTQRSFEIREKRGNPEEIAKSLNNMGNIYFLSENEEKAITYYWQAAQLRIQHGLTDNLVGNFNNLAIAYEGLEDLDSAVYCYEHGLRYVGQNVQENIDLYLNLGDAYNKIGQYQKALKILYGLLPQIQSDYDKTLCYQNIAFTYENMEQYDSAYHYLELASTTNNAELKRNLYLSRLILNLKLNGQDELVEELNQYVYYGDSLHDLQLESQFAEASAKYEVKYEVDKEKAESQLNKEANRRLKAENAQTRLVIAILLISFILLIVIILFVFRFYGQKRRLTQLELSAKQHEVEQLMQGYELDLFEAQFSGQHTERQRIARDLHDRLGGLLAAVKLQIESLEAGNQPVAYDKLGSIKTMIKDGIAEVRNVSHNMQAEALKAYGLKGALERICQALTDSKKIKIDLYLENLPPSKGPAVERELYKIIMELFSNTLKHAEAHLITLQVSKIDREINVVYEDDGKGFETDKTEQKGLGISSINERIAQLDGNWQIDSRPHHGTIIIINIPL